MIGQNLNLRPLASKLESTIVKQEQVAKEINASSQEQFNRLFAYELVKRKLLLSKLFFEENEDSAFPFSIRQDKGYIVGIAHAKLLDDERKNVVNMYCNSLTSQYDKFKNCSGIVMCFPYMMNGNQLREQLYKQLPIGFVNLGYDNNSLERRFRQYCLK